MHMAHVEMLCHMPHNASKSMLGEVCHTSLVIWTYEMGVLTQDCIGNYRDTFSGEHKGYRNWPHSATRLDAHTGIATFLSFAELLLSFAHRLFLLWRRIGLSLRARTSTAKA